MAVRVRGGEVKRDNMDIKRIKKRQYRAIISAVNFLNKLPGTNRIIILNNGPFHIEAIRKKEVRLIRIVLDEITKQDEKVIREFLTPDNFTKEIWLKKYKVRGFKVKEIH